MFSVARAVFRHIWSVVVHPVVFTTGIAILLSLGGNMIYGGDFTQGTTIVALAALWSAAFWLDSDFLKKNKPRRPRPRKNNYDQALDNFNRYLRRYRLWQICGTLTIAVLSTVMVVFIHGKAKEKELEKLGGILFPGNGPTPVIPCSPQPGAVNVFFDNAVSVIAKFPHTIVSVNRSPRLAIDKKPNGSIGINAELFTPDGRIIAEIKDDKFVVNKNNYLEMERKSKSNLVIRDQYGMTVLDVTYINPTAVQISSLVVYTPRGDRMEIAPSQGEPRLCFDKDSNPSNVGDLDLSPTQSQLPQ